MAHSHNATSPSPTRPNNPSASVQYLEIQRLSQQLDAANNKLDNYTNLIASLSVELKQNRDNICLSCKNRVLAASLNAIDLSATPYSPRDTATSEKNSQPTRIVTASSNSESPFHQSEPVSPLVSSFGHGSGSSTIEGTDSEASFHTASLSDPDLPPSRASIGQVNYNPEIKQTLDLSMVGTFEVPGFVACVKFSRDGHYFAVATRFDKTHIYGVLTMSETVLVDPGTSVIYSEAAATPKNRLILWTVRFSPNSKYVATGAADGQIRIWDIKRKHIRAIFKRHTRIVSCIDFSPDGRFLASASCDGTIRIWCIRDGSSQCLSHVFRCGYNSVAFSPDGRYIVAGDDDGDLRIWGARTRQLLKKWAGHRYFVLSVAFQPDGQGMASGSSDQTWKSWNLSSLQSKSPGHMAAVGKEVFRCSGHTDAVLSISFSPDGRWVVTSSYDDTSRIWDATTGVWVCTLRGHTEPVRGSDFSSAGCYLVTGGYDDQLILWRYREVDGQP